MRRTLAFLIFFLPLCTARADVLRWDTVESAVSYNVYCKGWGNNWLAATPISVTTNMLDIEAHFGYANQLLHCAITPFNGRSEGAFSASSDYFFCGQGKCVSNYNETPSCSTVQP